MAFETYKIPETANKSQDVTGFVMRPSNNPNVNNTKFDMLVKNVVRTQFNALVNKLDNFCNLLLVYGATTQTVTEQGKNICPTDFSEWESGHYSTTTGEKEAVANRVRVSRLVAVTPSTTYYVNNFETVGAYSILFVFRAYNDSEVFTRSLGVVSNGGTFTTAANEYYIGITLYSPDSSAITYSDFSGWFSAEEIKPFICLNSESDKTYADFVPDSPSPDYPAPITGKDKITVNGTVYNTPQDLYSTPDGTKDTYNFLAGTGTANIGVVVFDGTEAGWTLGTPGADYINAYIDVPAKADGVSNLLCSHFPVGAEFGAGKNIIGGGTSDSVIYIGIDNTLCADLAAFTTWLASNNITVIYQKATPTAITGTPVVFL